MKNWIRRWNLFRVFRLIVGLVILFQGIYAQQWVIIGLGALFSALPIFNLNTCASGACSGGSCSTSNRSHLSRRA